MVRILITNLTNFISLVDTGSLDVATEHDSLSKLFNNTSLFTKKYFLKATLGWSNRF